MSKIKFIPIKTYEEYVEVFKSKCEELGRTIKVSELRKHEFGLPDSNWFVRNCPDLDVKFYRDFIEYLGYKNSHRKYTYEIYAEGRGDEINDYSANLILYTCETLNSNIRIFKYARLLQI